MSTSDIKSLVCLLSNDESSKDEQIPANNNDKVIPKLLLSKNTNKDQTDIQIKDKDLIEVPGQFYAISNTEIAPKFVKLGNDLQTPDKNFTHHLISPIKKEPHTNSQFLEKLVKYKLVNEVNKTRNEQIIKNEEMKECSFRPNIYSKAKAPLGNVIERLYQPEQTKSKQAMLQLLQKKLENEAVKKDCTFQPKINPKGAKARYMLDNRTINKYSRNYDSDSKPQHKTVNERSLKGITAYKHIEKPIQETPKTSNNRFNFNKTANIGKHSYSIKPNNSAANYNSQTKLSKKPISNKNKVEILHEEHKGTNKEGSFNYDILRNNSEVVKNTRSHINDFRKEFNNYTTLAKKASVEFNNEINLDKKKSSIKKINLKKNTHN